MSALSTTFAPDYSDDLRCPPMPRIAALLPLVALFLAAPSHAARAADDWEGSL
jgi:hypothetical protein